MNDSFYDSSSQNGEEEDYYTEEGYENFARPGLSSSKILMLSAAGIGILILAVLVVWFFFPRDTSINAEQLKILESRIVDLESKIRRFDNIHEQLIRLENETKKFAHAVDRFDQFETSTALRMDVLAKEMLALQNETSQIQPAAPKTPETASKKEDNIRTKFHTVRAGETLYSIGRTYGLSVAALRELNDLKDDITIYPGQKLVIKPGNQQ